MYSRESNFTTSAPANLLQVELAHCTFRITATSPRDQWVDIVLVCISEIYKNRLFLFGLPIIVKIQKSKEMHCTVQWLWARWYFCVPSFVFINSLAVTIAATFLFISWLYLVQEGLGMTIFIALDALAMLPCWWYNVLTYTNFHILVVIFAVSVYLIYIAFVT